MMLKNIFLLIFCGISLAKAQNIKQSDGFIIQHYTDEDGLPQNSIKNIARDVHGFVWMTTEDGLVRYDGRHFFTFGRGNALHSSRFWSLVQDWSSNLLYAPNQSGEILQITNGKAEKSAGVLLERRRLLQAIPWFHLRDARLGITGIPDEINGRIFIGNDTCIIVRPEKRLFVYTDGTIAEYLAGKKTKTSYYPIKDFNRLFCIDTTLYYLQKNGVILNILASTTDSLRLTGDISSEQLLRIPEEQQQFFWNNTSKGSPILFAANSFFELAHNAVTGFYATLIGKEMDAADNKIICALYDEASHKLLVGSAVKGLYVFSRPAFNVITLAPPADNVFYAHTLFRDTEILSAQGIVTNIQDNNARINFIEHIKQTDKYSIITDSKGFVWTKKEHTLFRLDAKDLHVIQYWVLDDFIRVLYEGGDHHIYIGTDKQIQCIDLEDSLLKPQKFCTLPSVPKCFMETGKGTLWVGMDAGLCSIEHRKMEMAEGTENISIRSLHGNDNELWFTTYERGFFLYRNHQLTSFPVDEQQYLLTAHCIVEDKNGFFWITTNKGLFKTSHADLVAYADGSNSSLHYQHYTKEDGFLTNEFNGGCQPCGLLLPDGWISFPSMNGLVYFNPDNVDTDIAAGNLFIDAVFLDEKKVADAGVINVPRDIGRINILVNSPNWTGDRSGYISYALIRGADTSWVSVGNDNRISLSTLPWGNYTLLIRRVNGFSKNRYLYRTLQFTVAPPWYLTPVFISICCIGMLTLIWWVTRWRMKWVHSKNKLLEQKINNKTQELRVALDALQISAEELSLRTRIQEKMIASISHDVKVPMGFLKTVSENLYAGLKNDSNVEVIQKGRLIKDHVKRLYFFMQNLLDYSKAQMGNNFSLNELVSPAIIIENKKELFLDIAAQTATQLVVDIKEVSKIRSNEILLGIVIHNLIDNAIKVSEDGVVKISVFKDNAEVVMAVHDSGAGFAPDILEWLNSNSSQNMWERTGAKVQSTGIGLYIVKDLAALLQIKLLAVNSNSGATVILRSNQLIVS
jgi:signal transduction histidine kinase